MPAISELFGRQREVAELLSLVTAERARLVTVTGVGGVGKTRLAIQVMEEATPLFPDGVHLVPLASVPGPEMVAATVAQYFGLGATENQSAMERVSSHLAERAMLLVLDNFEHVTRAAKFIAELLNRCPRLVILITSRSPLRIWGERVMDIAPLPVNGLERDTPAATLRENAAVQLFLARARDTGASLDETALPTVGEISRKLEGLPLALELAATHARSLPLETIAERLDQRLQLLATGPINVPERLRTMEASIEWTYELLSPAERTLFQRLSVYKGGFAVEMAVAIATGRDAGSGYPWTVIYGDPYPAKVWWGFDPTVERLEAAYREYDRELPLSKIALDPLQGIQSLVDQSLIRLERGSDGAPRYVMLETLREFGQERLRQSGEREAVHHAHAALMCGFVDAASTGLWVKLARRWAHERIDDELGNIRSALAWSNSRGIGAAELALRIANGLNPYWQFRGLVSEGIDWLDRALVNGQGPEWIRGDALISLAALCWIQGQDERADISLQEANSIGRRIGMVRIEAQSIFYRSLIAWRQANYPLMKQRIDEAFELFGRWQDIIGVGVCHLTYGVLERALNNPTAAAAHLADARALHDMIAYEWGMATGRYYGGEVARDLADWRGAAKMYRNALAMYWDQGDYWGAGASIGGLAMLAAARDQKLIAARLFGASEALCIRVGALLPPTERRAYARAAAELRLRLGGPLYDLAFGEGQKSDPGLSVEFAQSVTAGLLGETMADPWAKEANEATRARATLAKLTPKRRVILGLVAQGLAVKEIADKVDRDYNTVDAQLKAIQKAFGVESRTDLIICIYRNGLADLI